MTDQPDEATYDAYLLRYPDGSWLAQLTDLPGAYATGATQAEAEARLAGAIPAYFAWLSQHDEYTPTTHSLAQVVAGEVAEASAGPAQGGGAFFSGDAEPVSDEDLDWWLAALGWAYGDLVEQAQRMGAHPQRDALLSAGALAQLRVVALATGTNARASIPSADPFALLEVARETASAAFRATSADARATVREEAGQRWSVRRGLRESALLIRRATADLAALLA